MMDDIEMIAEKPRGVAVRAEVLRPVAVAETASSPVLERLHALVRRGYTAEIGTPGNPDRVVLRHLGLAPDLLLHADGEVEGLDARRPRYKRDIEPPARIGATADADHLRFMRFLDTVPPATFWHRNRPWRKKYLYLPAALIITWFACVSLTALLFSN
jgi:hypothetical protein